MSDDKRRSGRRVVLVLGPLAILSGVLVVVVFNKYGRGNFTRAARIVEARGRAYELAAGVARCTNRAGGALPPTSPWVPPEPRKLSVSGESSPSVYAHEAFACAGFRPSGEIHVQVVWTRDDPQRGAARARLDDDDDGNADYEVESIVECASERQSGTEERCRARMVTERRLGD